MSTLGKDKASVSISGIESYTKEQLAVEIQRFSITNIQLMTDKMEIEKVKVNLEANRVRLFDEKNFLIIKREELRIEIVVLNVVRFFNVLIRGY